MNYRYSKSTFADVSSRTDATDPTIDISVRFSIIDDLNSSTVSAIALDEVYDFISPSRSSRRIDFNRRAIAESSQTLYPAPDSPSLQWNKDRFSSCSDGNRETRSPPGQKNRNRFLILFDEQEAKPCVQPHRQISRDFGEWDQGSATLFVDGSSTDEHTKIEVKNSDSTKPLDISVKRGVFVPKEKMITNDAPRRNYGTRHQRITSTTSLKLSEVFFGE